MTTQNLKGLDALVAANKVVADSARKRGRKLAEEAAQREQRHERALEDAEIARRALEQQHRDAMAEIDHEAGQLAFVLGGTPQDEPADEEPAPAAPPAPADNGNGNGNDAQAGNPPTVVLPPAPAPAPAPARRRNPANPSNWDGRAWFFALLALIPGFWLASATYHPVWDHVDNSVAYAVLVVLWFFAVTLAVAFTVGWLFARITERASQNNGA